MSEFKSDLNTTDKENESTKMIEVIRQRRQQSHRLMLVSLKLTMLGLFLLLVAACSNDDNTAVADGEATIAVVATTGMIADAVETIGGERIALTSLMGPGVDPHLYSATESDVNRLMNAQIIFYNGFSLEARMERVLQNLGETKLVIPVAESIPADQRLESADYAGQTDPHVWMDVKLWQIVVGAIRDELIAFDPEYEDVYRANAQEYLAQLDALEAEILEMVDSVPQDQRILVTAHDAFNYFGAGYGFAVHAPQGISTESEAGVDDIRRTIDLVVDNGIPAIFVESSVPPDVIEAIIEGARDRGHQVSIGGELFSDAMGAAGTPEGAYLGMIRHNVETMTSALRGVDGE
jgi:manganese/zinc/iron transport system substrate-binding protein